jgi:hypothetical protein
MDTNYPHLIPTETVVVIANVLPSGAAFGVRLDDGDNCYIPVNVASATSAAIGDEFRARLVPNRYPDKSERTPWLAVHITRIAPTTPQPAQRSVQFGMPFDQFDIRPSGVPLPTIADRVRTLMTGGGVWTMATLFEELMPGKSRGDSIADYNAISAAVRGMYAKGECAKFQLWRSSDQSKPSREWFTCHPERADVDEWGDEA